MSFSVQNNNASLIEYQCQPEGIFNVSPKIDRIYEINLIYELENCVSNIRQIASLIYDYIEIPKRADIGGVKAKDLRFLTQMPNLKCVTIDFVREEQPIDFLSLTQCLCIEELALSYLQIDDNIIAMVATKIITLRSLELTDCANLTYRTLIHLKNARNLNHLTIDLDLIEENLTKSAVADIANISQLRSLKIINPKRSRVVLLRSRLPHIKISTNVYGI